MSAALSVVLVTPDSYQRIRKTIQHLGRQTVKGLIEVVIGAPSLPELEPDQAELSVFGAVKLVEVGLIRSTGEPRAAALLRATAPVVVFAEDHCWPEPGWAAALVDAHKQPWGGVGATLTNANPCGTLSWASFLLNFGPSVDRKSGGVTGSIPWHNSAYKADLLRPYEKELGSLLEAEGLLQAALEKNGHRLYLQAAARTAHVNVSISRSFFAEQFSGARLFWALRAEREGWPRTRRWAWALAMPGLFVVRVGRALRETSRIGFPARRLPALITVLCAGSLALTAGAGAGILFGRGGSLARRIRLEFHRDEHVQVNERNLWSDD